MQKPDFTSILHHARVRDPKFLGAQAIPHTQRLFKCECCNDSGVVQAWKLNRWAKYLNDPDLDPIMSLPVLCGRLSSCGEVEIQVFADRDTDENAPRTRKQNFKHCKNIGEYIASGKLRSLSAEQSQFIHDKVLEYRELLAVTEEGKAYVEAIKEAGRNAVPRPARKRLSHVGEILATFEMPVEPEPGVELDGVTVYTNDSPIPSDLSSDSLGF